MTGTVLSGWPLALTLFMGFVGTAGIGGLLKTWLDHLRGKRKQTDDVAMNLVQVLSQRVATVEDQSAQERALCDANLTVLRHRINNLSMSFNGLLLVMELSPDKAGEYVARIKEQRAQQELAEAAEKAAVTAASVSSARAAPLPDLDPAE
jgi:hypothetical protein